MQAFIRPLADRTENLEKGSGKSRPGRGGGEFDQKEKKAFFVPLYCVSHGGNYFVTVFKALTIAFECERKT